MLPSRVKIGPFTASVPPGLTLDGEVQAAAFCAAESIPLRRIMLQDAEIEADIDAAKRSLLMVLTCNIGIYAPHFTDGGGI